MNIAVFIKSTTYTSSYGGMETQNKILCEGLVSKGHKVVVYTPKTGDLGEELEEKGVLYRFVDCKTGSFSSIRVKPSESWMVRSYNLFVKDNLNIKYDIVVGQSSAALGVILHKHEIGIPIISVSHGTKMGELATKFSSDTSVKGFFVALTAVPHALKNFFTVQRQFVHGSDAIVAVSSSVKTALIDETYVEDKKVFVINNGMQIIEKKTKKTQRASSDPLRMIYVGQVIKSKGIEELVSTVVSCKQGDFTLDIIGSGSSVEKIKTVAKEMRSINLLGKVPYEKVLEMYDPERYDVFVFPTKRVEGFPMVLVEAMFGSLPIVAYNLGGVSDAVVDGITGYLIKPGNRADFMLKLYDLKNNPGVAEKMGFEARNRAEQRFLASEMVASYEKVFKEVVR